MEKDKSQYGAFMQEIPKIVPEIRILTENLISGRELNILEKASKTGSCDRSYISERTLVEGAVMRIYYGK